MVIKENLLFILNRLGERRMFSIHFLQRRNRGLIKYLRRRSAIKYLHSSSQEHMKSFDQLVVFAFDNITSDIIVNGQTERYILQFISTEFASSMKDKVILDIGANIGNHSVAFSKIAKEVLAFEPNSEIFELLSINTRNIKNIKCFNYGASNENKTLNAFIPRGKIGSGTIAYSEQSVKFRKPRLDITQNKFKVKKLDEVKEIYDKNIGLIKLDVEGHELPAFQGLQGLLKKQNPLIMFEQNRNIFKGTSKELEFIKDHGYSFFYEFVSKDTWLTPIWFPKLLCRTLRIFEVLIFGVPNQELVLKRISVLQNKVYPAILASKKSLI